MYIKTTITFFLVINLLFIPSKSYACSLNDIDVSISSWHISTLSDPNGSNDLIQLKGIGIINNKCRDAIGVQVQLTGYDSENTPIATEIFWPFSITNIPTGENPFNLKGHIITVFDDNLHRRLKTLGVRILRIKKWK